jgi:hypothetical protein
MLKTIRRPTPKLPLKFLMWNTPLGHGVTPPKPPDFGTPRFTAQQQAANPDKPMTRIIKDALHVGVAKVGFDEKGNAIPWQVTPQVLALLNSTSLERMRIGDAINLGKGHGDDDLIIHSDDLICPIDELKLANGVLWLSSYVTPEQKKYLLNPAMKVSVGVVRDYVIGDMTHGEKRYSMALVHVAVTDRPAQLKQGPFLALANSASFSSAKGTSKMDFAALIEVLNKLLATMGLEPLPPDVSEKDLVELIQAKARGDEAPATDPNAPPNDVAMCNRIAKSLNLSFDQAWAIMPKLDGNTYALGNSSADRKKVLADSKADDHIEAQTGHRPDRGRDPFPRWVGSINKILKAIKREMLPADTTPENFGQRLEESAQHLLENPLMIQAPAAAPAMMSNRQRPAPRHVPLSDDEVADRLRAQGIDPKYMPKMV